MVLEKLKQKRNIQQEIAFRTDNSVIALITAGRRSRFRFSSVHLYPAVSGRDGNRTHVRKACPGIDGDVKIIISLEW